MHSPCCPQVEADTLTTRYKVSVVCCSTTQHKPGCTAPPPHRSLWTIRHAFVHTRAGAYDSPWYIPATRVVDCGLGTLLGLGRCNHTSVNMFPGKTWSHFVTDVLTLCSTCVSCAGWQGVEKLEGGYPRTRWVQHWKRVARGSLVACLLVKWLKLQHQETTRLDYKSAKAAQRMTQLSG